MLSKFLRPSYRQSVYRLLLRKVPVNAVLTRQSGFIPPSQYDIPISNKFKLGYVVKTYWETIPLLFCTCVALTFLFCSILWAIQNKVDVVFQTHSRRSISRTMDLRHPTVHKIIIINQKYEPWPEMQDVLDKMATAEKRALMRLQSCSLP